GAARGRGRRRQRERLRRPRRGAGRPREGRPGRSPASEGHDGRRSREDRVVAVTAIVFDVGETLVDETLACERMADAAGVPRFTFMALIGAAIARGGRPYDLVWEWLGIEPPPSVAFTEEQ